MKAIAALTTIILAMPVFAIAEEVQTPPVPEVVLKSTAAAPVIDGKINDICWKTSAAKLTGFTYNRLPVKKADPQTVVFVTYDKNNLYLAFKCYEPLVRDITDNVELRDGQVWVEDCVDFTIDPEGDGKTYYQFAINAKGTLYDTGWGGAKRDYDAKGARTAACKGDGCWTVEASIPWADFPITAKTGSTWRANFCRNRFAGTGGLSSWSWVNGWFHNPERRGYLKGINVDFAKVAAMQAKSRQSTKAEPKQSALEESARKVACAKIGKDAAYGVCVTSSDTRVVNDRYLDAQFEVPAQIELARNETESVQLVLVPFASDLKNVKVSISPIKSKTHELPAEQVSIHPIGFVKHSRDDAESYGDVILNNALFDVSNHANQGIFITVKTNTDTPAGDYFGTIRIEPQNAHAYEVPVKVKVWDFALSNTPTLDAWFGATGDCINWLNSRHVPDSLVGQSLQLPVDPKDFASKKEELRNQINKLTEAGNLSLNFWPFGKVNGNDIKWHGDAATDPYYYSPDQEAKLKEWFKAFGQTMEELGAADRFWLWIWDEPSAHHHNAMKQKCDIVRSGSDLIGRAMVGGGLQSSMTGYVNMWVPLTSGHSAAFEKQAKNRGERYWWYTCNEPPHPFANCAFIDAPLIESRLLPWMMYKEKVDGFLFWETCMLNWDSNIPYAVNLPSTQCGAIGSGDGIMWYKGVASCRLNAIADGYEDHQYLTILSRQTNALRKLAAGSNGNTKKQLLNAAGKSEKLCIVPENIVADLTHYTSNPGVLLAQRRAVAQQIVNNNMLLNVQ